MGDGIYEISEEVLLFRFSPLEAIVLSSIYARASKQSVREGMDECTNNNKLRKESRRNE